MANVIVIDGPEKAGKTTFISALTTALKKDGLSVFRRHWSTPDLKTFHSFVYTRPLAEDFKSTEYDVIIWDRSWVSEYVYPGIMPQFRSKKRVLWNDPWLAEWCFGRALKSSGMGIILLGPDWQTLKQHRDGSDHPCSPVLERDRYEYYGTRFGWLTIQNNHSPEYVERLIRVVKGRLKAAEFQLDQFMSPPNYCGSYDAPVVFIGESRNLASKDPGVWLPFSTKYTTMLGREFGKSALDYGWTNTDSLQSANQTDVFDFLCDKAVVACGKRAQDYCAKIDLEHLPIGHPSHGFRWGQGLNGYRTSLESLKSDLRNRREVYG